STLNNFITNNITKNVAKQILNNTLENNNEITNLLNKLPNKNSIFSLNYYKYYFKVDNMYIIKKLKLLLLPFLKLKKNEWERKLIINNNNNKNNNNDNDTIKCLS